MISSLLAAQAGNVRTQIAATILKANAEAEKSTVLALLGAAEPDTSSLANSALVSAATSISLPKSMPDFRSASARPKIRPRPAVWLP